MLEIAEWLKYRIKRQNHLIPSSVFEKKMDLFRIETSKGIDYRKTGRWSYK